MDSGTLKEPSFSSSYFYFVFLSRQFSVRNKKLACYYDEPTPLKTKNGPCMLCLTLRSLQVCKGGCQKQYHLRTYDSGDQPSCLQTWGIALLLEEDSCAGEGTRRKI